MAATTPPPDAPPLVLRPQPGPQEAFIATRADIAFYGGAAGGGKSWALLFEPLRHAANPGFGAVILRRTFPEITTEGGLWDESAKLYPHLRAVPSVSSVRWDFPGGGTVSFGHMQHEADLLKWHSAQIPLIGFDELTTFTERQFVYMLSRNRSTCGVRPYIRGTCNPDAESWVAKWVEWYIDPRTGYPIPERAGAVRWFVRDGDALRWADTREELVALYPKRRPKSFTFIPAKLEDNKILEAADPGYRANLEAQMTVDRERLLGGNWKVVATGTWFDRAHLGPFLPFPPVGTVAVRYWDTAATTGEASCWTAGVLVGRLPDGRFAVLDVARGKWEPLDRDTAIVATAHADRRRPGVAVRETWIEQEPGGAGVSDVQSLIRKLAGFNAKAWKETGDKDVRSKALAAQWQSRNVLLVAGDWNEAFLREMGTIPGGKVRDQADAAAGAFNRLCDVPAEDAAAWATADTGTTEMDRIEAAGVW